MPAKRTALIWSQSAQRDIVRLYDFLKSENPEAAKKAILAIKNSSDALAAFPSLGKRVEGRQDREIVAAFGKNGYVIRYRLDGETPVILRIWYTLEYREKPNA